VLFGFHLGHPQEVGEQIKVMALRQPRECRESFQNQRNGLVRAIVPCQFVDPRPPTLVKRYALTLSRCLFQNNCSESACYTKIPSKRVQPEGGALQLLRYESRS